MSAGLLASTRTPPRGPPDESLAVPAIAAWANAAAGEHAMQKRMTSDLNRSTPPDASS